MPKAKHYEVYDLVTGELLTKGSERKCAVELGVGNSAIGEIARGKYKSSRFRVVCKSAEEEKPPMKKEQQPYSDMVIAARKWDAFCEPIRKKYGIPVYRPGKGSNK